MKQEIEHEQTERRHIMVADQLAAGGRLVVPVGPAGRDQVLHVIERTADGYREVESVPCRFVPLLGESGFQVEGGPGGLGI